MRRVLFVFGAIALLAGAHASLGAQTAPDLITDVRAAIADQNFARGESMVRQHQSIHGMTPESAAALSWLARGTLAAKQLDKAAQYAGETYRLAVAALKTRRLDDDAHLQTALGAAIEVEALVRAARGERSEAVYFLRRELDAYRDTTIHMRIQKNINLLSLEGQPAPPLAVGEQLGRRVPTFDDLKGKVVVLFFWAHWCPDCKIQGPILESLLQKYRSQGLAVVAPTQRFGYAVEGQPATPDDEMVHILKVRDAYYGFLRDEPVPVSDVNHKRYGVSSTPTLALVDRGGIVRVYHPGRMTEQELEAAIQPLLRNN